MNVQDYLKEVSYVGEMEMFGETVKIYKSKFDDSYMTQVGMEDNMKFLADKEITQELTHGVGFSPKDGKWYGWSHRAIYGFGIGSTCSKGDCHYVPSTPEALIDDHADFFMDISAESAAEKRAECQILDDRSGIRILHTPIKMAVVQDIDELEDAIDNPESVDEVLLFENDYTVIECGRGEWIAETLLDAKQMAQDFNSGVS